MRMAKFEQNERFEKYGLSEGRPQRNPLFLEMVKNASTQNTVKKIKKLEFSQQHN